MRISSTRLLSFTAALFLLCLVQAFSQGWEKLATLENSTNLPAMAAANGKIYVVSGSNGGIAKTWEYDPSTNVWSEKAPIPQSCFWASAVGYNNKIYVMGGGQAYPGKNYNYIYDPATNSWTKGADMITPRMYHSAAVANGKIYLIGGQNGDNTSEWAFEGYDPSTNTWQSYATPLHNEAWYCGAASLDNTFYRIAGGGFKKTMAKDYFDAYNIETNSWEELPAFPVKLHASAAVTIQNKIIVMGGMCNEEKVDSIYYYTKSSGKWALMLNKLPEPMVYHKAAVIGDYVYVFNRSETDQKGFLYRYKFGNSDVVDNLQPNKSISLYPNPCSGSFKLCLDSDLNGPVKVWLTDIFGKLVYSSNQEFVCNGEPLNISTDNLVSGAYFVYVSNNNKVFSSVITINK